MEKTQGLDLGPFQMRNLRSPGHKVFLEDQPGTCFHPPKYIRIPSLKMFSLVKYIHIDLKGTVQTQNVTNIYKMITRLRNGMLTVIPEPIEGSGMSHSQLYLCNPTILSFVEGKNVFLVFLSGSAPTMHPKPYHSVVLLVFKCYRNASGFLCLASLWLSFLQLCVSVHIQYATIYLPTELLLNVLVLLGSRNKMLPTGWLVNNRLVSLTVLEAGSTGSRLHQGHLLMKAPFLVHGWCLLAVFSPGARGEDSLCSRFYKGAEAPPWGPEQLPEALPPNTVM